MFTPVGYLATLAAACARMQTEPRTASARPVFRCTVTLDVWDDDALACVSRDVSISVPAPPEGIKGLEGDEHGAVILVLQVPSTSTVIMAVVDGSNIDATFGEFAAKLAEDSQSPVLGAHYTINGCGIETDATIRSLVSSWRSIATNDTRLVLVKAAANVESYDLHAVMQGKECRFLVRLPPDTRKAVLVLQYPDTTHATQMCVDPHGEAMTLRQVLERRGILQAWGVGMEMVTFTVDGARVPIDTSIRDLLVQWRTVATNEPRVLLVHTSGSLS